MIEESLEIEVPCKRDLTDHEGVLSIASRSASGDLQVDERKRDIVGLLLLQHDNL